jgi:hypothetical protein
MVLVGTPLTTNVASAESPPVLPTTVIVYVPGAALDSTVNVTVGIIFPFASILQVVGAVTICNGVLVDIEHVPSFGLKPLPVIATIEVPAPALGVNVILGENGFTANPAVAESPAVLPLTVTTYGPWAAVGPTVNEAALIFPLTIVQVDTVNSPAGLDEMTHAESVNANPLPETVTTVLSGPEAGLRAICGPVTTKLAEAISPVLPLTDIVYVPGVAVPATTKPLPTS